MKKTFLYYIKRSNKNYEISLYGSAIITKRTLIFCDFSDEGKSEFIFDYSFDTPFKYLTDGEKINTKISYMDTKGDGSELKIDLFIKLNNIEKLKMSWYFNRLWFQQPSNIMWIINIFIALIASLSAIMEIGKR